MIKDFLENISLFNNLTETDFGQICGMVEEVRLSAGEELFSEGSPGDRAYIITRGSCEVFRVENGERVCLRRMGRGETFGETAIFSGHARSASVEVMATAPGMLATQ